MSCKWLLKEKMLQYYNIKLPLLFSFKDSHGLKIALAHNNTNSGEILQTNFTPQTARLINHFI